jgi:hypothetical protein
LLSLQRDIVRKFKLDADSSPAVAQNKGKKQAVVVNKVH